MKNIAIVCGGYSGEYEISIGSGKMVAANLDKNKYNPYLIEIGKKDWFYADSSGSKHMIEKGDFTLMLGKKQIRFDGIFNAIHGTPGEDGKLQGYFDVLGLPYTSCDLVTSALTFNKYNCNRFVSSFGIKVARGLSFIEGEQVNFTDVIEELGLPLFIKPAESGSSVGITKVNMEDELDEAVSYAFSESDRILIEECIKGRELTCCVFNKGKEVNVLPLIEIISKNDFFDYEAKYSDGMAEEIPPVKLAEEIENDIKAVSSFLFRQLSCKGFVRFDYILSDNELYFIEVNTIPGITEASIVPKMLKLYNMPVKSFFTSITDNMFEY